MAVDLPLPQHLDNLVGGAWHPAASGATFDKTSPHDGRRLYTVARSAREDVEAAVQAARAAQAAWAATPPVRRGMLLHELVVAMQRRTDELACVVAAETGKAPGEAAGEVGGAAALGLFYASEGQRLYGRTTTSAVPGRMSMTWREPRGVAALIVAANTPIANVAWKVFPALVCGNSVVLKAAEDTPGTAWLFAQIAEEVGLPPGVLNVVQGYGVEAGAPLVEHVDVDVISFTGSTAVGRFIQRAAAERMVRISLELGGKNPLVVCDDADLERAVHWTALSAFSNAGQRCASGSRILVFADVYDRFREMLVERTRALKVGPDDGDDLGPVINERQLAHMLQAIDEARASGASILVGGSRLDDEAHARGSYLAPTVVEGVPADHAFSTTELFGPIATLYPVAGYDEALALANDSPYGLTASIHTRDLDRALDFARRVQTGVAVVNAGTYGSEPHMPFGGRKASGNGTREPGTEALDVYSELKDVYVHLSQEIA